MFKISSTFNNNVCKMYKKYNIKRILMLKGYKNDKKVTLKGQKKGSESKKSLL